MKANHNECQRNHTAALVFINNERTHFESKSQHSPAVCAATLKYLSITKEHILKANHNIACNALAYRLVFINNERTHFESKSQRLSLNAFKII